MQNITFIDTEIQTKTGKIDDIGGIKTDGSQFHSGSVSKFIEFLHGSKYICGHNIFNHDLKYIQDAINVAGFNNLNCIDTLYLSPLLFPTRPYHKLLKDDKIQPEELNNPLNDSIKARDLFFEEVAAFQNLDDTLKRIYYFLLKGKREFYSFFRSFGYQENGVDIDSLIRNMFRARICERVNLSNLISEFPIELAYSLALINTNDRYSITPPWVMFNFPAVQRTMFELRSNPCLQGCRYCNDALDVRKGLKQFFGYESYKTFDGKPLQEEAARASVSNKSLLAVFPTGGGKSIAFQVPALMSGVSSRGLTVIISPLQALMKDQVDNLEKTGITSAVTINGLLDPVERIKSYERVEDGSASILYISPESLRSKTIEHLLLKRNVVRFVIDEAHCLSTWGQDFRVDYLHIGDFIKSFQKKKNLPNGIPVSCFTATAKLKVIEDIQKYFRDKLNIEMELYVSNEPRRNLRYKVIAQEKETDKYKTLRDLIEEKKCPTILYVSRTKEAEELAKRLTEDGYLAKPYHGQMNKDEKTQNQDSFMKGDVKIIVATSAFGMGVDKRDIGMVIHYEISDSLENYLQESGRAGRGNEANTGDCFVLFNDEDLSKHFVLLNRTKLNFQEIQEVWKAIKDITRFRLKVSQSALEIARKAGWDEGIEGIETRVRTAISALEEAGYVKRGQNNPRLFATSINVQNFQEASNIINSSRNFDERQKENAVRIIKNLISSRSIKLAAGEDAESRVDYLSDRLGIEKAEVIHTVNLLREEKILGDSKDVTAFIKKKESKNHSLRILESYSELEKFLLTILDDQEKTFNIKEINQWAEEYGCKNINPEKIRTILNYWAIKNWIKKHTVDFEKNYIAIYCPYQKEKFEEHIAQRNELAKFIINYLYDQTKKDQSNDNTNKEEVSVEFSILELKEEFERQPSLFKRTVTSKHIEDALFYLSKIRALIIEDGFMVIYNAMTIERIEKNSLRKYKIEDYQKLHEFYQNKIEQIHIVGEYARKMISDYKAALQFAEDYFKLNYSSFLNKYFKGNRAKEIQINITPAKFQQIFGELSTAQLAIINDKDSCRIVVAAGPGSGKTRILVHKLASLLLLESVRSEQLLMLTFSRSAATVFKKRLIELIGSPAYYVAIKTFHSYCFDLIGKMGSLEKSDEIIKEAVHRIETKEVEPSKVTKTVLVIDEAQDINADEFMLITALMKQNEGMRLIAVGDDDQNIFEFRGSNSVFLKKLIDEHEAIKYELVENFRSKSNLVDFSNQFLKRIPNRLKQDTIIARQLEEGKIKLVRYTNPASNLITPLVNDILSQDLSGTTCVLTRTNEEALQTTGLLLKNGFQAKLIQSNEGFDLYNLLEIRFFLNQLDITDGVSMITDDVWREAKRELKTKFIGSPNLEICLNLIKDFEKTQKYKFKSDLETLIHESKIEDFFGENIDSIFVSTIHKAKGREFDNLFLMLNRFDIEEDENLRPLYVALTRAKNNLTIHYDGNYLDSIVTNNLKRVIVREFYPPPAQTAMQLTHKDVVLSYFASCQLSISQLYSGDKLTINGECCGNLIGTPVLKFSKERRNQIEILKQRNYAPKDAKIKFIVYWKGEDSEKEIKIVLPELVFERTNEEKDNDQELLYVKDHTY